MKKFIADAPKRKVIKALEILYLHIMREKDHISLLRENQDGNKIPLTISPEKKLLL